MNPAERIWFHPALFWAATKNMPQDQADRLLSEVLSYIWRHRPSHTFQYFGLIWGTPFVLFGQYLIWGRFVYSRWKKRRTYYALTNRRALIVQNGLKGRTSSSAYFDNLSVIDKRVRSDGIGIISFGGPVRGEWQWGKGNPPRPCTLMTSMTPIPCTSSRFDFAIRRGSQRRKRLRAGPHHPHTVVILRQDQVRLVSSFLLLYP